MSCLRFLIITITAGFVAGCSETLTYGERSGFNLSIRSDAAENVPIEVNGGFQRRVVGLIPASGRTQDGRPMGESVNMFSNFDLAYEENDTSLFGGKLTIGTSFASGKAATELAGNVSVVEQIVKPTNFPISDVPRTREALTKLGDYIVEADNRDFYMQIAATRGLRVYSDNDEFTNAINTLDDPSNGSMNVEIAEFLNLI